MNQEIIAEIEKIEIKDLYNYLVHDYELDLYKFCHVILYYSKTNDYGKMLDQLEKTTIGLHPDEAYLIDKYVMEFCKDKFIHLQVCGVGNFISRVYCEELFGYAMPMGYSKRSFYENLDDRKIKFLLKAIPTNYVHYDESDKMRLALECKKLGYTADKVISKLLITKEEYDGLDQEYYEYCTSEPESRYARYLIARKKNKIIIDCTTFIDTLYNTAIDLNKSEIVISLDSITAIKNAINEN